MKLSQLIEIFPSLNALTDEEVTISLPTISPDDLGDVSIEPAHLAALDGIIIVEKAPGSTRKH